MLVILYRTIIMFILVVLAMRIMGKRQLGQLEPSELVTTIVMSELASMPIADKNMPLHHPVSAILIILTLEIIMSTVALKSIRLRNIFGGKASVLIENGKIRKKELRRNRVTIDELIEELRQKDVADITKVEYAVLERGGMLSVVQKPSTMPIILISDGHKLKKNMEYMGVTEKYILDELSNRGITDIKDVFLLMLDNQHKFYLYTQEDVA